MFAHSATRLAVISLIGDYLQHKTTFELHVCFRLSFFSRSCFRSAAGFCILSRDKALTVKMLKNRVCVWISLPGGDRDPFQWVIQTRTHTNPNSASIKYQALFTYSTPQTSHCQQSEWEFSTSAAQEEKVQCCLTAVELIIRYTTVGHDITDRNSDKLGLFRRSRMICKCGKYSIDFLDLTPWTRTCVRTISVNQWKPFSLFQVCVEKPITSDIFFGK